MPSIANTLTTPGHLHRFCGIEALHLAAQHRRARDDGVQHAWQADVDAVLRLAVDDDGPIRERRVVLADVAERRRILELQRLAGRHVELGRCDSQSAVAKSSAACLVDDLVVLRLDLVERHAPLVGRGLLEHLTRRRAAAAHRLEPVSRAARAIGVLVAVLGFISRRLYDAHALVVGFQLVGHDPRQAGADALAHFGAVDDDADRAVGRDRDEDLRAVLQTVRHAIAAVLLRFVGRTAETGQTDAEYQPCERSGLQKGAAAGAGVLGRDEGAQVHHASPFMPAATLIALRMRV